MLAKQFAQQQFVSRKNFAVAIIYMKIHKMKMWKRGENTRNSRLTANRDDKLSCHGRTNNGTMAAPLRNSDRHYNLAKWKKWHVIKTSTPFTESTKAMKNGVSSFHPLQRLRGYTSCVRSMVHSLLIKNCKCSQEHLDRQQAHIHKGIDSRFICRCLLYVLVSLDILEAQQL